MISEDVLKWAQFRAQNLFQQLKEEENWEEFCQAMGKGYVNPEPPLGVDEARVPLRTVRISKDVPKLFNLSKTYADTSVKHEPTCNTNFVSRDIRYIKGKLEKLEHGFSELKRATEQEKIIDSNEYGKFVSSHDQKCDEVQDDTIQKLHNCLKDSIARRFQYDKPLAPPVSMKRKGGVGFSLPYVLREERAMAKRAQERRQNMEKTKKKWLSFKRKTSSPQRYSPSHLRPDAKWSSSLQESCDDNISEEDNYAQITDDLSSLHYQTLKRVEVPNLNTIKALSQKINDIEVTENKVKEKWKVLPDYPLRKEETEAAKEIPPTDTVPKTLFSQETTANNKTFSLPKPSVICPSYTNAASTSRQDDIDLGKIPIDGRTFLVNPSPHQVTTDQGKPYAENPELGQTFSKENLNSWLSINQISDTLISECFHEFLEEVNIIPSAFAHDLFEKEFIQHK